MTEYRAKLIQKIGKKIAGLIDETDLILDAEIRHINEYDACEELCAMLTEAGKCLRMAAYQYQKAEAEAGLEDMQDSMQENLDKMTA